MKRIAKCLVFAHGGKVFCNGQQIISTAGGEANGMGSYNLENLTFRLYGVNGSVIQNGEVVNQETIIETGGLPPAAYYLRIIDNDKEIKTFKIIKN